MFHLKLKEAPTKIQTPKYSGIDQHAAKTQKWKLQNSSGKKKAPNDIFVHFAIPKKGKWEKVAAFTFLRF